jgi:hypothetical protein
MFRPWFRLIARVGETGVDEYFLSPVNRTDKTYDAATQTATVKPTNVYTARFTANRDGEVFLYVNDAALALPWLYSTYYKNNQGAAKISIKLL